MEGWDFPKGRWGPGPFLYTGTPAPSLKWLTTARNVSTHFSIKVFIFTEQIFAFKELRVSMLSFSCPSLPTFLLQPKKELIVLGIVCAYGFSSSYLTCLKRSISIVGVSHCKYLLIFFCDFDTMYHHIVLAFIKQTINIQRKENERLETCLLLWAPGKILFCFIVFTLTEDNTLIWFLFIMFWV